jgi:hypothetical protein
LPGTPVGEAAAAAALVYTLDRYPGDGKVRFFWDDIKIKSVIAIAPTVSQYKPADHEVELTDINYLLIQGVNDQDFPPSWERAASMKTSLSPAGAHILKAPLYMRSQPRPVQHKMGQV